MSDFTLRQLRHFIGIANHGSISAAAKALHFSSSTLSASLDELERALSTTLVVRRKAHGVTLTPDGRMVLGRAVDIVAQAQDLQSAVDESAGTLSGSISIGCYHTLAPSVMPGILRAFRDDHPALTVDYREADGDILQTALAAGELDVAFMYDADVSGGLVTRPLYAIRPYVLLPDGHPQSGADRVTLESLIAEPFILFDLPPSAHNTFALFASAGLTPDILHRTSNVEFVRSLVRHKLGWSILVQRPHDRGNDDGLIARELAPPAPSVEVVMARSQGRPRARVAALEDYIAETYATPSHLTRSKESR